MSNLLLTLTLLSLIYWVVAAWSVHSFFRAGQTRPAAFTPRVSILKPVKGMDVGAYDNFASFCRQDYPEYELLFGVANPKDPVVAVVKRLQDDFPDRKIRLIHVPEAGLNPKSVLLHHLAVQADGQVLVISDSDIRVTPDYLHQVVRPLVDSAVGAVTCPYRSIPSDSNSSRLESLYLDTGFLPSAIMAARLFGVHVGLGATIAVRRDDLMRLGGYESIADYLTDDFQIVSRVAASGFRVELSDHVVTHVLGSIGYREQWERELRWARGIRVCGPRRYLGLGLTFTTPLALGFVGITGFSGVGLAVLGGSLAIRWVLAWKMLDDLGNRRSARDLAWLPVRDCLSAMVWSVGLFGRRVMWRGREFCLLPDGRLETT